MERERYEGWQRYEDFIERVVAAIVRKYHGAVDAEDLRQSGLLTLLEVRSRYDARRAATFEGYLRLRVRGAIKDAARRQIQRRERDQYATGLRQRAGGSVDDGGPRPRLSGVALATLEEKGSAARKGATNCAAWSGGRRSIESEVMYRDFVRTLPERLKRLPQRQREVIKVCDIAGETYRRAGARLGLTPGGICRRRQRALAQLRATWA